MFDHISIPARDLVKSTQFYRAVLSQPGRELLVPGEGTVGFGKKYPKFSLNARLSHPSDSVADGFHICLRASSVEKVKECRRRALSGGDTSYGEPGIRRQYSNNYYAAFIQHCDGNCIEAVTFVG
jgi:catechol 2,3-dioxygenase-like lactoylglutathione lyase family enzyme